MSRFRARIQTKEQKEGHGEKKLDSLFFLLFCDVRGQQGVKAQSEQNIEDQPYDGKDPRGRNEWRLIQLTEDLIHPGCQESGEQTD